MQRSLIFAEVIVAGFLCSSARRISHLSAEQTAGQTSLWEAGNISVKLWTWNSGKEDLSAEAEKLSQTSADILVTCQTEARSSIKDFISPERWTMFAHGEHWGMAGGGRNAQILSAFARRPADGSGLAAKASIAQVKMTSWAKDVGPEGELSHIRRGAHGSRTTVLRSRVQVHATDLKGKGGISVSLMFPESALPEHRVDVLCAHLDSESNEARHTGLVEMMADMKTLSNRGRNEIKKQVLTSQGGLLHACAMWDAASASCPVNLVPVLKEPGPDAVIILGDLNFRLDSEGIKNFNEEEMLSAAGRLRLSDNDHLVTGGQFADRFVQSTEADGFGFHCNRPFEKYLPTYKRVAAEGCADLGSELQSCGGYDQPSCGDSVLALAKQCYPKQIRKDDKKNVTVAHWSFKNNDLQLGWLDRVCFRTMSNAEIAAPLDIHLIDDEAWQTWPGRKDKIGGSDHMPVAFTLGFSYVRCSCRDIPSKSKLFKCNEKRYFRRGLVPHDFFMRQGTSDLLTCPRDYRLVNSRGPRIGPLHAQVLTTCGSDGILRAEVAPHVPSIPVSSLECRRYCDLASACPECTRAAADLFGTDLGGASWEHEAVEGDNLIVPCTDGVVLGSQHLQCGPDGKFVSTRGEALPPICLRRCSFNLTDEALVVREVQFASKNLTEGPYGPSISQLPTRLYSDNRIYQGGHLKLGCRNRCVVAGNSKLTCLYPGTLEPSLESVTCACSATVSVSSVDLSAELKHGKDLAYMKLQILNGPFHSAIGLQAARHAKEYFATTKFRPKDVTKAPPRIDVQRSLETAEVHITVCSKSKGEKKYWSSGCMVLAETGPQQGFKVSQLLERPGETSRLTLPFEWHGIASSVNVSLSVSHYSA